MKIVRSSLLLAGLFGFDKLVGLFRQFLVLRAYGVTAALDAYNASNNLPDAVVTLLSGGALAIALIPVLTETLDRDGRDALWALFSRVLNLAFALTAVIALGLAVFAGPLVRGVVVPRFQPDQQELTITLMRLNLIAMLIFCLSGLASAGLQANQHFLLPGLAPILYNVGQITGVLLLSRQFGIYGLAYGVILGAALHLAIQVPGLLRHGFRWAPAFDWRHPAVLRMARLIGPRIFNVAFFQLVFIATDNFASGLYAGAVSALAYGWLIMQMPETLIGTAAATALLPALSDLAARDDLAGLRATLRRAMTVITALTVPATLVSMLLVGPAARLVFQGRNLTAAGVDLIVAASLAFLPGITGHALVEIGVRAFYARQKPLIPLIAAGLNAGVFIGLCLLLTPRFGHVGIALANTLAFSSQAVLLLILLRRRNLI